MNAFGGCVGHGPFGALVSEKERLVIVDCDDNVFVLGWEAKSAEFSNAIPVARSNEERSIRISLPDLSNRFGIDRIHHLRRGGAVRFIKKLKGKTIRIGGIVCRDLSPDGVELFRPGGRIGSELVEMMDVDDDVEALIERILDEEIRFGKHLAGERVVRRRTGVMVPGNGDSNVVEAFGANGRQIRGIVLNAPVLAGGSFEIVAEIYAAAEAIDSQMRGRVVADYAGHIDKSGREGWPGEEAYPVQPMVSQLRSVLDAYAGNGGRYREIVLLNCGHTPQVEHPEAFRKALFGFLEQ